MRWNKQWKQLTRDQKAAWKTWAKSNPVLLDHGVVRRVSGEKAFTIILNNRAIAGEAANPTVVPAAATWLSGALSVRDVGPFTTGAGFMGFRTEQEIVAATKWFVWATRPLTAMETHPQRWLRFVKSLALGALANDTPTASFADDYRAVVGSFNGPGQDGEWAEDHFVWFRLHQYVNGQLSPGVVLKGRIQVEL
ncbi:MAG TPA: hypothetical protein VI136_14315 [Verrucomicrobiae bacterium]